MSKTIYEILEETNPSYMDRDSILVKTDTIIEFKKKKL